MDVALTLVSLVAVVVVVTGVCRRYDLSAPIVLVAVGVLGSYLPMLPEIRLNEEIVLVGLLPPLLYNAALGTSLIHFSAQRWAILSLSVGLVVFTAAGVAVVAHTLVPGLDWWAAFAIGAVVAPPDAVAATAVAKRIGLPRAIVTLLEGESLLNDATALVALRTAIAAAGTVTVLDAGLDFVVTAVGGVVAGFLVFLVVGKARRFVQDPVIDTSISMATPFVAYVLAEEVHASGVLAVVIAGLLLGHKAPILQTASSRIAERLTWRTVGFLLENAVFLLIGLQARWIIEDVAESELSGARIAALCAAVLVAVVVLRFAWVFPARRILDRIERRSRPVPPSYVTIVGWAGMRGVVTLAAAFAIPEDAPHREVLLLVALVVTGGTLALHGLTLPWLARRLRVPGPDPREDALARAELMTAASQAGLARLDELEADLDDEDEQHRGVVDMLRSRLEQRDFAAWERLGTGPSGVEETPSQLYARIRLAMLAAERGRVLELRSEGRVPHEVVADVLATLDVEESIIDARSERHDEEDAERLTSERAVAPCKHLGDAPSAHDDPASECEDCVREGTRWVHLRRCLACGHVACCDSSPRRHAAAHFRESDHPVMASAEPGEAWRWCFVDEVTG